MPFRTWFITGISSGFGKCMAEWLLARGDRVSGTVRRAGSVAELASAHPGKLWTALLDLSDLAAIRGVVDRAFSDLGRIDVVVNNAGYALFGAAEALTDAQIAHQIATNLTGPIHVARAALPHLRAQGGGRILALSTYGGQATFPGASLYHASKWGLEGFFDSLSKEVSALNIGVTIVEPGGAPTRFRETASAEMAPELEAYGRTPVGMIRAALADPARAPKGDLQKMVRIMIDSVDQNPAPKRIALGTDAYSAIHGQLQERLTALEAQRELALSTDLDVGNRPLGK